MATGLLVIGVGRATRLLRFLGELEKTYEGRSGSGPRPRRSTPTARCSRRGAGRRRRRAPGRDDGEDRHDDADAARVQRRQGRRPQASTTPPGRARRSRRRRAPSASLVRPGRRDAATEVDFRCGRGRRHVRARPGRRRRRGAGVGAHLVRLRRTAIGPFDVADASPPASVGTPLPVERAVAHLPRSWSTPRRPAPQRTGAFWRRRDRGPVRRATAPTRG